MLRGFYPQQEAALTQQIAHLQQDISLLSRHRAPKDAFPPMTIHGTTYSKRADAAKALYEACRAVPADGPVPIGSWGWRGFALEAQLNAFTRDLTVTLIGAARHTVTLGSDASGNLTRLDNRLSGLPNELRELELRLQDNRQQTENARVQVQRPFPQEDDLRAKETRLAELNTLLNLDEKDPVILDDPACDEQEINHSSRSAER